MYSMQSFREDGTPIEVVNEEPAFYALYYCSNNSNSNQLIGYFISVEACRLAVEDLKQWLE